MCWYKSFIIIELFFIYTNKLYKSICRKCTNCVDRRGISRTEEFHREKCLITQRLIEEKISRNIPTYQLYISITYFLC